MHKGCRVENIASKMCVSVVVTATKQKKNTFVEISFKVCCHNIIALHQIVSSACYSSPQYEWLLYFSVLQGDSLQIPLAWLNWQNSLLNICLLQVIISLNNILFTIYQSTSTIERSLDQVLTIHL